MNFTQEPEQVQLPSMHYVYVERFGPFNVNAWQAWQTAHSFVPELTANNAIAGYLSLYKIGPQVYRAGFALAAPPVQMPEGLTYDIFAGGNYVRFVLTGPYMHLPAASGQAWSIVKEKNLQLRDDFAVERYMNDPRVTPEDQLVTEILIPVA
jgi:hypothetical protein